jgi:prevent-host-death family protein
MKTVNIQEAKTNLLHFIEGVEQGEPLIIAKAGIPVAKAVPISEQPTQRIGFMEGQFEVPDDFDTMFAEEIRVMFEDGPLFPVADQRTER